MKIQDKKNAAAKRECAQLLRSTPTPGIPGLALKPGTGTTFKTPVPANLDIPDIDPRNPFGTSAEQVAFLCLRHLPAILNSWQSGTLFGLTEAQISTLVGLGVLEPLVHGRGIQSRFALPYIQAVRGHQGKLHEITTALIQRSAKKNGKSKKANP
jgi:hypothetical protein